MAHDHLIEWLDLIATEMRMARRARRDLACGACQRSADAGIGGEPIVSFRRRH